MKIGKNKTTKLNQNKNRIKTESEIKIENKIKIKNQIEMDKYNQIRNINSYEK